MKYQNIINLLDDGPNEPSKVRTKNKVDVNDDLRGVYNTNSEFNSKTLMLRSIYGVIVTCTYLFKEMKQFQVCNLQVPPKIMEKKVMFKNCASLINCTS